MGEEGIGLSLLGKYRRTGADADADGDASMELPIAECTTTPRASSGGSGATAPLGKQLTQVDVSKIDSSRSEAPTPPPALKEKKSMKCVLFLRLKKILLRFNLNCELGYLVGILGSLLN